MLGEIETAFHVMNHRDQYHGTVEVGGDRFVPVLKSNDLRDDIFELVYMILTYFAGIKRGRCIPSPKREFGAGMRWIA